MYHNHSLKLSRITLCLVGSFAAIHAPFASATDTEVIEVHGARLDVPATLGSSADLLNAYGVTNRAAGGVASLPVLNGLSGDRIKVLVDGADVTAACANQMNPPLSYVSASQIQQVSVVAGISPVSLAGDNIGGVISLDTLVPRFSDQQSLAWHSGDMAITYQSNQQALQASLGMQIASDSVSVEYRGAFEQSDSFKDGNGNTVFDTLYRAQNHALTAAFRDDSQQLAIKFTHQYIPYQGFANQYMDMVNNQSVGLVSRYQRTTDWGDIRADINWHKVEHEMGFFSPEKTGMMPMNTEAEDTSVRLAWQHNLSDAQQVLAGIEYVNYEVDDWWPAVEASMMMGPQDYININDGQRQRVGGYVESNLQLTRDWQVSAGVRLEHVTTDASEVQAYNSMPMMGMPNPDHMAAMAFNSASRKRSDNLLDVTLLASYTPDEHQRWEFGLARKNRAPNLYERYSWGRSTMAMNMIGWFGDGNGYVGDLDLSPETALTAGLTYRYRATGNRLQFSVHPYYTQVKDYIDANVTGQAYVFGRMGDPDALRNKLQFTNLDATLYGLDLDARWQLASDWNFAMTGKWVRGERDATGEPLYQLQPLTLGATLEHRSGGWLNRLGWQWTDNKERVDPRRLERETDSYQLVSVLSRYQWQDMSITMQVTNLLDVYYNDPLAGVSVADVRMMRTPGFEQLAGKGRSFHLGIRYQF